MTSRLDRLFALLEHCPNATLREAAADQLGQLAQKAPAEIDATLTRLHGLLLSKSWSSRIAAAEAVRAIVTHLPAWKPMAPEETAFSQSGTPTNVSTASFLSLSGLQLERVLANGARLYSMDVRDLSAAVTTSTKENGQQLTAFASLTTGIHPPKSKRCRKSLSDAQNEDEDAGLLNEHSNFCREDLNRRMGLTGDTFLSSVLAGHSGAVVEGIISDEDFKPEFDSFEPLSTDVLKSVEDAHMEARECGKRKICFDQTEWSTDWPLNSFCVRLLADLWDFRWETRHGAASALRELLSNPRHTKQAGTRNKATDADNVRANRVYIEDIVVRVIYTLALDQFSDFICDEVVAPVRETAAQVLGVVALYLDSDQIQLVASHLLQMMTRVPEACSYDKAAACSQKTNWMAVHSGLLGLKYLLAARNDISKDLLSLVCPSLLSALVGNGASTDGFISPLPLDQTSLLGCHNTAGEDDIRSAASAALLAISDHLVCGYRPDASNWPTALGPMPTGSEFNAWLMSQIWHLLAASHELSPASGPLLLLVSSLLQIQSSKSSFRSMVPQHASNNICSKGIDITHKKLANSEDHFCELIALLVRFMHHSSSNIRKTAILTLRSLVLIRLEAQSLELDISSLESIFEQIFHRIVFESNTSLIRLLADLWTRLVMSIPLPSLVFATLHRVGFWLCQAMQPTSTPFPEHMLRLPASVACPSKVAKEASSKSQQTDMHQGLKLSGCSTSVRYIGGREILTVSETERQLIALDTRLTAVSMVSILCQRLCQSSTSVIWAVNNNDKTSSQTSSSSTDENPALETVTQTEGGVSISVYLINHLLTDVHLKDRLAMQRFVAGLLLAAWPSQSSQLQSIPFAEEMFFPANNTTLLVKSDVTTATKKNDNTNTPVAASYLEGLNARLQSCLTDVTYYEEILGLFKTMQEDCRRLLVLCISAGALKKDAAPTANKVWNIVQCQSLLKLIANSISSFDSSSGQSSAKVVALDLAGHYKQAELSVGKCLSLQLFWSSRVELSVASAMVNVGWVQPGRLSLLIRPLMETIRAGSGLIACPPDAQGASAAAAASLNLPSVSASLRLQCLAAYSLARLLWSDYVQLVSNATNGSDANSVVPLTFNPSKALVKVIQNLAKYLVSSDPVIGNGASLSAENGSITSLTLSQLNWLDGCSLLTSSNAGSGKTGKNVSNPTDKGTEVESGLGCSSPAGSGPRLLDVPILSTSDSGTLMQNKLRRTGSLITLISLLRVFTSDDSKSNNIEHSEFLDRRQLVSNVSLSLPTFWEYLWVEPISILQSVFQIPVSCTLMSIESERFADDVRFLRLCLNSSAKQRPLALIEEESICRCLCLMVPAFSVLCGQNSVPTTLTEGLITLGLRTLRLKEVRPRYAAANFLSIAACFQPVTVLNFALLELLPRLQWKGHQQPFWKEEQLAAIEAIYHIVDGIMSPRYEVSLSNLPICQPFSVALHGCTHERLVGVSQDPTLATVSSGADNGESGVDSGFVTKANEVALRVLLSYVVVIIINVLKRLSDQCSEIRILATRVFTKLLVLLPLEEAIPDAIGMDNQLKVARVEGRNFVQCLLHPDRIQLYADDPLIKANLRPYQKEGVNWLLFLQKYSLNGILADDLGLGKTLQTICALTKHHSGHRRSRGSSLIVCPATLCSHWWHEVEKFVNPTCRMNCIIYQGNLDQRALLQEKATEFSLVITTYDIVRNDSTFFEKIFWEYVILDEGHMIKNSKSKLTCSVKRLRAKHRLILTGTPVQNRVGELWSLFDFLMPGFLGTEANFAARFARPVASSRDPKASSQDQRAGQLALEQLHRIVLPLVLRRLKEDVLKDLPAKVIQDYLCNMTPLQQHLYAALIKTAEGQHALELATRNCRQTSGKSAQTTSTLTNANETDVSAVNRGGANHRGFQTMKDLLSVCNHPCLVLRSGHPLQSWAEDRLQSEWSVDSLEAVALSGKLIALRQLLFDCGFGAVQRFAFQDSTAQSTAPSIQEDLMSQHRALMFFQSRSMLRLVVQMLSSEFKHVTFMRLDGSVPVKERHDIVTRFNQDPSIDILLLTTSVGGLGLNLTGADTVIFVEHDWNPCKDLQAMDRAHRIGQRRMVNVYRLITTDSLEERIMNLQAFKLRIARTVVSDDNQSLAAMDTGRIFDKLVSLESGGVEIVSTSEAGLEWGDLEAAQYAQEYNLAAFVARNAASRGSR